MPFRYFSCLTEIHTWSLSVRSQDQLACPNCHSIDTFTPHGWIYSSESKDEKKQTGKRIICNSTDKYGGCGRTQRLMLMDTTFRRHYPLQTILVFIQLLMTGVSISNAYGEATKSNELRQANRWWQALRRREPQMREDLLHCSDSPLKDIPQELSHAPVVQNPGPRARSKNFRKLLKTWWKSTEAKNGICPLGLFQLHHKMAII